MAVLGYSLPPAPHFVDCAKKYELEGEDAATMPAAGPEDVITTKRIMAVDVEIKANTASIQPVEHHFSPAIV